MNGITAVSAFAVWVAGNLAEAEGFWLKAGLPLEAVDMYTKSGARLRRIEKPFAKVDSFW